MLMENPFLEVMITEIWFFILFFFFFALKLTIIFVAPISRKKKLKHTLRNIGLVGMEF